MIYLSINGKPVEMNPGFPATYADLLLPRSNAWHVSNYSGKIILQRIAQFGYVISLYYFQLRKSLSFRFELRQKALTTTIVLKNVIRQTICGVGKLYLKQSQFSSLYGSAMQKSIRLKDRKAALFIDFTWTQELLQQLLPADSPYWPLFKQEIEQLPTLIGEPYRHTNPALQELLDTLFDMPYSPELQDDTINTLMTELLENILSTSLDDIQLPDPISGIELRKVSDARRFILDNIGCHFSIGTIASKVGLSRTTLIKRFRQVTGRGIHEFLMYHRCISIRDELMNTNVPFKVLAKKAGYSDVPNFINGFRKHMGCSPASLRKRS